MEQQRLTAIFELIEELVAAITTPDHQIDRDRLLYAIELCAKMDAATVPLGLMFAATTSLDKRQVRPFLTRLPATLSDDTRGALDTVSETILMITDTDLQASGTIAASLFVLRALPNGVARDRVLESLLVLIEKQHKARAARHSEIFALFAQAKDGLTLDVLPDYLSQVSETLEDIACEKDVFLDNPIELIAKTPPSAVDTPDEHFKEVRVRSGADIPTLRDEIAQIEALQEVIGWSRDRALTFVTDLYERRVMDSRSKLGLSVAAICGVVTDLKETFDTEVHDIRIEDQRAGGPYSYDWDHGELLLHCGNRGSITTRMVKEARDGIVARLTEEKIDRETSALDKAIDRYRKARASVVGGDPAPEEDEAPVVEALAKSLNLPLDQTYDMVGELYGSEGIGPSLCSQTGISLQALRETVEAVAGAGEISKITVDTEVDGRIPFSVDGDSGVLKLHAAFEGLSGLTLQRCATERSIEPAPLAEPDDALLSEYKDPEKPGSVANEHNVKRFIEEFRLDEEHAGDSFEVMLEGCPGLGEAVSIQAMRVIVATLNARLGADSPRLDVVTAFSRELPGTQKVDHATLAWLTAHRESDLTLNMLTLNFNYGEGKRKLPAFSDEVLLDWCRHHVAEYQIDEQ